MKALFATAAPCVLGTALGQPSTAWVNEPGGVALALDAADNAYSARWDYSPGGDIYLGKRDAGGALQWEVRYDNTDTTRHQVATWVLPGVASLTVGDADGNSCPINSDHAAGSGSLLRKLAPNGATLWEACLRWA